MRNLTHFLEDINQSASLAYKTFKGYQRQPDISIGDILINFGQHVTKLKDFNILLQEPVLAFRALKSANLTPENERLVKATISELTLSSMSGQLQKIMHSLLTLHLPTLHPSWRRMKWMLLSMQKITR